MLIRAPYPDSGGTAPTYTAVYDPAKRTFFAGQTRGTLTNANKTFSAFDFGSAVNEQVGGTALLTASIGYFETMYTSAGGFAPYVGLGSSAWDWTAQVALGQSAGSVSFRTDAGGVGVIYTGSGTVGATPPSVGPNLWMGIIVYKPTNRFWLVHPNGTTYPESPTFDAAGNLTSGTGWATGITSYYFGASASRDEVITVNAGTDPFARTRPANVPAGWA